MRTLEPKKLLTLITAHAIKGIVIDRLKSREVGGYTMVDATGVGAFGVQSGALDSDSNVLIYVILSEARLKVSDRHRCDDSSSEKTVCDECWIVNRLHTRH